MSFSNYSEYKDSGVAWLGNVPVDWKVTNVKALARVINGYPFDARLFDPSEGFPLIRIRDLNQYTPDTRYKGDFVHAVAIDSNDVLIGMDGDFNVGRWLGEAPALLNQRMCCVRADSPMVTRYLEYVLPTPLKAINDITYSTTVKHLSSFDVLKIRVAIPESEAGIAQIVQFLDRETSKIDALVAEQQKLIALLKEKRQAVISHAVTKGLDPDVPMKDSGIEWLGEVPAHWEVKRLKFLGEAIIGLTYDPSEVVGENEGVLVLRSSNVQGGRIVFDDNVFVSKAIPEKLITKLGDILICSRNGSRALIGKNALIRGDAEGLTFGAFMTVFRSRDNAYLAYVFNSSLFEFQSGSFLTSTVNQLTTGNLYSFEVPVPPEEEQANIASFLDQETDRLNQLILEAQRAVGLLKERRSALISAAVTGKIDVRGAVER